MARTKIGTENIPRSSGIAMFDSTEMDLLCISFILLLKYYCKISGIKIYYYKFIVCSLKALILVCTLSFFANNPSCPINRRKEL